ncbi:peptide ABC transporter substrate-binding protein [Aerococcaceae bacterium zg-ZJ1578]|uniref:peptide ABC transporter substrate-binding protein n=1 Tax=Aerococcaceae bacterium zg-252 TaxID=2796928 RepID=UPI001A2FB37C|nr:peptide ABC transporter substrate-binding protein [Aerococcaceae bacterium zg-1578]
MSKKWIKGLCISGLVLATVSGVIPANQLLSTSDVAIVQAQEQQLLKWTQASEITTLDSAKSYDTVAYTALRQLGEGLLRTATDGSIQPAGAVELPEISEDGLTYTFKLREDAKWSNGEPVTAKDYVYAWRRAVNPEVGSANAFLFTVVKNAAEIADGKAAVEDLGVEAVSDYELKVTLKEPKANFVNYVAHVNYYPQNQAAVEAAGDAYGTSSDAFLGNGPFTVENWNATALEWTYTKNPEYYGADKIQVDQIHIDVVKDPNTAVELFEAGEIDAAAISGPLLAEFKDSENLVSFPGLSHSYIEMGISSSKPLQNENLRKALSYVIDRQTLTKNILSGGAEAVKGLVPQNVVFNTVTGKDYVEDQQDYGVFDVEKAKEHWEKAKEELGTDTVELELLVTDSETTKMIGEFIQGLVESNLEGFKLSLRPLPAKNRFAEMMSFDFDIAVGGWSASLGDADEYLVNFLTNAEHNHAQFFDKDFDALVKEANSPEAVANPARRYELLHEAENYLLDRRVLIPLIQNNTTLLVSDRIDNIEANPNGSGVDFTTLTFK